MSHSCPHCGKPINPAKMLGEVKSPRKEAAAKANGERLRRMYANAKKLETASDSEEPEKTYTVMSPGGGLMKMIREKMEETPLPAKPATLEGKKAAAMAALAGLVSKTRPEMGIDEYNEIATRPLHETPRAPFDLNLEGEPHRVTQMGKRLGLFYVGGGEAVFARYLEAGELEKYWEERIK